MTEFSSHAIWSVIFMLLNLIGPAFSIAHNVIFRDSSSEMEIVTLSGASSGHGINISDSTDDGVIVGSVDHGSPAHQSDKIAKGTNVADTLRRLTMAKANRNGSRCREHKD